MPEQFDHEGYLSPFTWRYGSEGMRTLWSQVYQRCVWRRLWVALAAAQARFGLVTDADLAELEAHVEDVDIAAAHAIEAEIRHDLMAELKVYAAQCPSAGRVLHLGATSMDIEDNAEALRVRRALDLVLAELEHVLRGFAARARELAFAPTMGFTHLQPAEPTTTGYRIAQYAQDLLDDYRHLQDVRRSIRGKGFKGAVGTSASYVELLGSTAAAREMEEHALAAVDLEAFPVATQTYPRKQDLTVVSALASLAQSLYRFAFDVRLLQSPPIGEWAEPFGRKQVGSSAMPFKRNPIVAENMDSLARYVATLPRVAWDNAAHSHLERTLDDSANRRSVLPEAFLAVDELLVRARRLIEGLTVDRAASARLLAAYGAFSATERLLMAAVKAGGDRQELHEVLREHALRAWPEVQAGRPNPLVPNLAAEPRLTRLVPAASIPALLDGEAHVGDAAERAVAMADLVDATLALSPKGDS
ncbi:MAG: adenylosuccinate lyase [Deltaproteobacteria bacterium]|nr:adenylosuccinate lyase [Deltaproteobacteria bacterium]